MPQMYVFLKSENTYSLDFYRKSLLISLLFDQHTMPTVTESIS